MLDLKNLEVWFVTGSQHLYGEETLRKVAEHAQKISLALDFSAQIPVTVCYKAVVKTPDEIYRLCQDAPPTPNCIGIVAWMHTFSPAKMWIRGLQSLQKPLCHLHTQFNRDIPWSDIDMDFMNLNQSAHGGPRVRGNVSRMAPIAKWWSVTGRIHRYTSAWVCGYAQRRRGSTGRAQNLPAFGDNMRQVAVTEGDKVEAEMKFGYSVNGYGTGDLVQFINDTSDAAIDRLVEEYEVSYTLAPALQKTARNAVPCAMPPASKSACAIFFRTAISKDIPIPSKTCTASCNYPALLPSV